MEDLIRVDKRIARRLWNNNNDVAFVPEQDASFKNHPNCRDNVEERDFDKRVNGIHFYYPCKLYYFARQKDVDGLKLCNPKVEAERDKVRSEIENARTLFLGKKNGNYYDAVLITDNREILQYKALLKDDRVYVQFGYDLQKGSDKTNYIDTVRVDNVVSVRRDTMEKDAVFALKNWVGAVRRVNVLDIAKGEYRDYDTNKVFVDKDMVLMVGQRIPERTLNTTDKNGVVICDDGQTREVFNTKALMDKISEYRDEGRLDKESVSLLVGGIRDAEGQFRKNGIEKAKNILYDDMEELAPHLREDYYPYVDVCVSESIGAKRVEEITDEFLKVVGIECDTPMRKEMKDFLVDRVNDDMGKTPMFELFDNALGDMWEDGRSNAPGGMVYTDDVVKFFDKHEKEISKFARNGYPDKEDPYFRGSENKTWAVRMAFQSFIEDVANAMNDKEKEIAKIPLKKVKKVADLTPEGNVRSNNLTRG